MNNYTVSIYVSECQTDTFSIEAEQSEAQGIAAETAIEMGYDVDDIISIEELCPCGEKLIYDSETCNDVCPENCEQFQKKQIESEKQELKQKILKEIQTWNISEFSDCTEQDIIDHVQYCLDYQNMTFLEAIESANQAMAEGNL